MSLRPTLVAVRAACSVMASLVSMIIPTSTAHAQQPELAQVVVSASRFEEYRNQVSANVRVITREEIEKSGALTIIDVLSQFAGVPVRGFSLGQLGLGATVDLGGHGATATSNTLILLDGQRLNPFDSTGVAWEQVTLEAIERIEILYGGAGVQFGNGAVGGVVNLITRRGTERPSRANLTVGNYGTVVAGADLSRSFDGNALTLSANKARTDGWRRNSAAESQSIRTGIGRGPVGGDRFFFDLFASESTTFQPGGALGRVGEGDLRAAKFNNVGSFASGSNNGFRLGGSKRLGGSTLFEAEATYGTRNLGYREPFYSLQTVAKSPELVLTPRIQGSFAGGTFVAGLDLSSARQDSNLKYTDFPYQEDQSVRLLNRSVYLIGRIPMHERIELSLGARHQLQDARTRDIVLSPPSPDSDLSASQRYAATAGDVALNWNYREGLRTWFKWNQSFRFANTDDFWGFIFDPVNNVSKRVFVGAIRPQVARTIEVGGEWVSRTTTLSVSAYRSLTEDEIRYDPASGSNLNTDDSIRRQGLIFDASTTLHGGLVLGASGRFQRAQYDTGSYAGTTIALVPDQTLNARVSYPVAPNWTIGGVVTHVGSQHYDASPGETIGLERMPSYTVTDAFAAYRRGSWEWRLAVRNLTNERYSTYGGYGPVFLEDFSRPTIYYHYPSDPRTVALTARYTF